jgi:hypothetical protein
MVNPATVLPNGEIGYVSPKIENEFHSNLFFYSNIFGYRNQQWSLSQCTTKTCVGYFEKMKLGQEELYLNCTPIDILHHQNVPKFVPHKT